MRTARRRGEDVASITSAPVSHSEDVSRRTARYLATMLIRTGCFVLAVVSDGALRWVAIVGAVVLPYVAVIGANTVAGRGPGGASPGAAGLPTAATALPPGVAERVWPSKFGLQQPALPAGAGTAATDREEKADSPAADAGDAPPNA